MLRAILNIIFGAFVSEQPVRSDSMSIFPKSCFTRLQMDMSSKVSPAQVPARCQLIIDWHGQETQCLGRIYRQHYFKPR